MKIRPSSRQAKKYMAIFDDGTITHFGAHGYGDFITYSKKNKDLARQKRRAYIARHGATESWTDPRAASTLSRYILWEHPTLKKSIQAYTKRFKV